MGFRLFGAVVWATLTFLIAGCGSAKGPSVRPKDVELRASIRPSDVTACFPDVQWILEVELDRTRAVPLYVGEDQYMYEVDAFDGQRPLTPSGIGDGCDTQKGIGATQVAIGNDGRTFQLAVRAAHESGDLPATYLETRSDAAGFTYLGSEFPVKVRYYLNDIHLPSKIAVIYAHYETHMGKDYSWTKTIYAEHAE